MPDPSAWGISPGYVDAREEWKDSPPDAVAAILDAMGADGDRPPESPVVVTSPDRRADLGDAVEIRFEDGGSAPVRGALPDDTPPGYHRLAAPDGTERDLIVSPGRCYLPGDLRSWGWAVQLYSARSTRSWGIGDLGDLDELGRWARGTGADVLLVNPLHAPQPGPQQPSPYFPSSRRWRNPLYVRIEDVPGAADRLDDVADLAAQGRKLNAGDRIDRDEVYRLKMEALERLWHARTDDAEFHRFRDRHGESLTDFATYMTLVEHHRGGPSTWPAKHRDPARPAVKRFRVDNEDRVLFHEWVQWLLERQLLAAAGEVGLVHDLAIGVDPEGADAWLWGDVFANGVTVGAPPDLFNSHGQNWGLPPFDPWRLRSASYGPYVETLRTNLVGAAGLRVDHVLGLFRLFWIPDGAAPGDGTYVRYPYDDLLDILALESHRARAFVVGEDLGTVEDVVPEEMTARSMLSYRLLWFDERPERYPKLSLAAVTNHDLPTVAGMWTGEDLQEQRDLGLDPNEEAEADVRERFRKATRLRDDAPPADAVKKAHSLLAGAPSAVVVATLEDALEVLRRPNQPGTTDERPNWSMPLPVPIDDLGGLPLVKSVARTLSRGRRTESASAELVPTEIRHDYAQLSEVRLHYAEAGAGTGPLVVMLHGFPELWSSWRHQIPFLAERGFHVVAPDMRGYNLSDKPPGVAAYAVPNLVGDVRELIEHFGEGRAHVVGHDWGGVVAWYFAMTHPVLLDRLAILNSPHPQRYVRTMNPRQLLRSWYIGLFQLPWLPERMIARNDFEVLRKMFRHDPSDQSVFTDADVELYVDAAKRSDDLRYPINYYRALLRPNPLPALRWRVIERPVQVIWGERDRALESSLAEPDRAWVTDVRVHRLPDATHWVQHDEPDTVNDLLGRFLSGDS
ncbi:MAG TPA: 4-alpha-glucanotransferase [Actinomycetota bacterium]|nr:4-alpha-glucanotransferase [Actinomycetota bacterium]